MASPTLSPTPTISIDVTKDLKSSSALTTLLTSQGGAIFGVASELAQFAGHPIEDALGASSVKLSISGSASWTPASGIGVTLNPDAECSISIGSTSTPFPVAMSIDSTDTTNVVAGPSPNVVYVNIELDFGINVSVSGSGTASGVGIAGKASGGKTATFCFCQPVDGTLETIQALKTALSNIVFPLQPDCAARMTSGCVAKMNFDGTLNVGLDVTYGLGDYKVSAPSVAQVQKSLQNAIAITPPSFDINAGAKGSISYAHSDHFGLIANKTGPSTALLYLTRAAADEIDGSVGISVGVTATKASVTLDPSALQQTVQKVTGNSALASSVVSAASQPVNNLETSLNAKLNSWISDATGNAGLTVGLSRQTGRTSLFTFQVNFANADLARRSWSALLGGSVADALQIQGLTLLPGSGVSDYLKRASTIQFEFFNLFNWASTTDYFSDGYTELGPDGTIRFHRDIGQEQQIKTKTALSQFRIHFVAEATEDVAKDLSKAEIDLYIELSESGSSKTAGAMANVIGSIPANSVVQPTQKVMIQYVAERPSGTLNLINVVKRSAYQKLSCSPYNGSKPFPLPHEQDQNNWKAFQNATEALVPDLGFVPELSFALWMDFNRACVDQVGSTMIPDRRQTGNINAPMPDSFDNFKDEMPLVSYFLVASAGFMNLCDDLETLATATAQVATLDQWNRILALLTNLVTKDVFIDYAQPTASALLGQCSIGGAQVSAVTELAQDSSSLTCTLTLA